MKHMRVRSIESVMGGHALMLFADCNVDSEIECGITFARRNRNSNPIRNIGEPGQETIAIALTQFTSF